MPGAERNVEGEESVRSVTDGSGEEEEQERRGEAAPSRQAHGRAAEIDLAAPTGRGAALGCRWKLQEGRGKQSKLQGELARRRLNAAAGGARGG
jgi:hypothetical protein